MGYVTEVKKVKVKAENFQELNQERDTESKGRMPKLYNDNGSLQ